MNTCDGCKHFNKYRDPRSHGFKPPFGGCGRWIVSYANEDLKENECQVESDEGWGMIVGPKFGCILHEPKGD